MSQLSIAMAVILFVYLGKLWSASKIEYSTFMLRGIWHTIIHKRWKWCSGIRLILSPRLVGARRRLQFPGVPWRGSTFVGGWNVHSHRGRWCWLGLAYGVHFESHSVHSLSQRRRVKKKRNNDNDTATIRESETYCTRRLLCQIRRLLRYWRRSRRLGLVWMAWMGWKLNTTNDYHSALYIIAQGETLSPWSGKPLSISCFKGISVSYSRIWSATVLRYEHSHCHVLLPSTEYTFGHYPLRAFPLFCCRYIPLFAEFPYLRE